LGERELFVVELAQEEVGRGVFLELQGGTEEGLGISEIGGFSDKDSRKFI
jgi:hypothetical protein